MHRPLFLLPLLALTACDAPGDVPMVPGSAEPMVQVHTFVGVAGMAEDGRPFDRMEYRIPSRMLPVSSPRVEIDQGRWDVVRHNKDWPRSVVEREALGMEIQGVCNDNERCDHYNNCDGTDTDGFNADGVDFTEFPVWTIGSVSGWTNCEWATSMPNRCNGAYSGMVDYTSSHCLGCNTIDFLTEDPDTEQLVLFTESGGGGYCARFVRYSGDPVPTGSYGDTYSLSYANLVAIHPSLNDNISGFMFSGHWGANYAGTLKGSIEFFEGHLDNSGCYNCMVLAIDPIFGYPNPPWRFLNMGASWPGPPSASNIFSSLRLNLHGSN